MATTLPSHVTLFTATEPLEHGVTANLDEDRRLFELPADLELFAEHVRARGYRTAAVVSATPLKRGAGLEVGFEHWVEPAGAEARAAESVDAALAWLGGLGRSQPAFLWLHLFDPHGPYEPPAEFDVFEGDERLAAHLEERNIRRNVRRAGGRRVRSSDAFDAYDGEIRYVDHEIGRFFEALGPLGRRERAAWLIVGDHGEGLGQHRDPGHGQVWVEQLRVPLLMGAPGVEPDVVEHLMGIADVLPTWLALAGVDAFGGECSGRNVLSSPRTGLYASSSRRRADYSRGPRRAWIEARWKLILGPGGADFLYDLEADPHQLEEISDHHPETCARMRARLERHVAEARARAVGRTAPAQAAPEASAARLEELQSLGYIADD